MSEHVNKPEAGLKTQEEIKLKVSQDSANADDFAQEKSEINEEQKSQVTSAENECKKTDGKSEASKSSTPKNEEMHSSDIDGLQFAAAEEPLKLNASSSSSFEKITSKGLRRHQMIIGGCVLLSLVLLGLSTFDFTHLISKGAYINANNELILEKKEADLSPSLTYCRYRMNESGPEQELSLVAKSTWKGRSFGFVDSSGKVVITPKFGSAQAFSDGLAAVEVEGKKENKWGYIDSTGAFKIPAKFDSVGHFRNGLAAVSIVREVGIIDKSGRYIVKPQFSRIQSWGENFVASTVRNKFGILNPKGKWILPPTYSSISGIAYDLQTSMMQMIPGNHQTNFDEHAQFLKIEKQDLYGIVSKDGKIIIPPKYDEVTSFRNGVAGVKINGKIGFVDTTGKILISPVYDAATSFDDLIAVEVGKKWQFIDKFGKPVSSLKADRIVNDFAEEWFADGLGPIIRDGKVGYINAKGEFAIPPVFDVGIPFNNGYAAVWSGDRWKYIDTSGKFVPGFAFGFLSRPRNGKVYANVPGILYPFVQASSIKTMRNHISDWIAGENPFRYYGSPYPFYPRLWGQ